jgi:hypothetical protein
LKLDNKTAKAVHSAEGSTFTLLPEDEYILKLDKVSVASKPDRNGQSYWVWDFTVVSGQTTAEEFKGKPLRTNTGFSENQLWFAKMVFEAFEAKPNVDTDTLLGKEVKAIVGQREIQAGARKGQLSNDIQTLLPVTAGGDDDNWDEGDAKDKGGAPADDDEPDF